jgi:UDP-N-acetylglucosamine 2-epimerase (non-hydrolysing)
MSPLHLPSFVPAKSDPENVRCEPVNTSAANSNFSFAARGIILTAPLKLASPYKLDAPPRRTSAVSTPTAGTRFHCTHPPNGSLSGTPSKNTPERLAPLAPTPRRLTPCVVGLALRLLDRRKIEKPTDWRRTSSRDGAALVSMSVLEMVETLAGVSEMRVSIRFAVTVTSSRIGIGVGVGACARTTTAPETTNNSSGKSLINSARKRKIVSFACLYYHGALPLFLTVGPRHMHDSVAARPKQKIDENSEPGPRVLVLFGTRPEAIKLAPVIHELRGRGFRTIVVSSSQHKQILKPFLETLKVDVDFDLSVMRRNQTPNEVCSKVMSKLDKILAAEEPDLILVQGDTTTALAGALAGFNRKIPVGHVEAGLRSGNLASPFPEEMNRRVISQMASLHFAATDMNRDNLLTETVPAENIFVTGNPVVDSLQAMLENHVPSRHISDLLQATEGKKRILLTTHRRESFGTALTGNLQVLAEFADNHRDVCIFFPVHPNPNVKSVAAELLGGRSNVHLLEPLDYSDFLAIMKAAWLIVSDSGGVQEEAPSLGKPLLVIRENTERPEAIRSGISKLVGIDPGALKKLLEENYAVETWVKSVKEVDNPFGDGRASSRIVNVIEERLAVRPRIFTPAQAMPA